MQVIQDTVTWSIQHATKMMTPRTCTHLGAVPKHDGAACAHCWHSMISTFFWSINLPDAGCRQCTVPRRSSIESLIESESSAAMGWGASEQSQDALLELQQWQACCTREQHRKEWCKSSSAALCESQNHSSDNAHMTNNGRRRTTAPPLILSPLTSTNEEGHWCCCIPSAAADHHLEPQQSQS